MRVRTKRDIHDLIAHVRNQGGHNVIILDYLDFSLSRLFFFPALSSESRCTRRRFGSARREIWSFYSNMEDSPFAFASRRSTNKVSWERARANFYDVSTMGGVHHATSYHLPQSFCVIFYHSNRSAGNIGHVVADIWFHWPLLSF